MFIPEITDKQMNELRIIATKGGENANLAFSRWMREKARLEISDVSLVPFGDIVTIVGEGDRMVISILLRMNGDIRGNAVFVFSEESAVRLIEKVSRKKIPPPIPPRPPLVTTQSVVTRSHAEHGNEGGEGGLGGGEFDAINRSILEETGNIVGTAFLNSLVSHLGIAVSTTSPVFIYDYAEAILEMAVMEYAPVADHALLFETRFYEENTKIDGYFFILPSPESLDTLLEKIEGR